MEKVKAVAIVSGGMDSTVLAYWLAKQDYDVHMVSFDYGQRHRKELEYARKTARALYVQHDIIDLSALTGLISNSALTGNKPVPEGHYAEENMSQTVVPNRNMMMLSIAGAIAVNEKAKILATGVHAGDHPIYPDCRPDFIHAFNHALRLGNEGFIHEDFKTIAPFVHSSKASIARIGHGFGVPFEDTWSCYQAGEIHCGRCGTCVERAEAFYLSGVEDPTTYESPNYWKQVTNV